MEFFLLFILAFFMGAVHGWNLREKHAKKFIESLAEAAQEEEDDNVKLKISDQVFNLDTLDVHNIEEPRLELLPDLLIDDIEILE